MQKQSILGRIQQLVRANLNAMIDRAEDPEKMLDQLVLDFTNNIADAEEAVAQTIANVRVAEADLAIDRETAEEWGRKAAAASAKAEQMRTAGDTAGADRFDELARVALSRQIAFEKDVHEAEPRTAAQNETVEQLKDGLTVMKTKLGDLKSRRDQLVARSRTADAQAQMQQYMRSLDVLDPTSDLARFEDRVRRQEALVQGREEAHATSLEDQFAELDDVGDDAEVERRLAALKDGSA